MGRLKTHKTGTVLSSFDAENNCIDYNNKNDDDDEVYISYDHKDSSVSSFISYLLAALSRQGISVVNEELDERFSKVKALVLVVFSENYCMEKRLYSCLRDNNDDYVVVPVYYRVSVLSVKQYLEGFCDAFKMLKLSRGHEYDGKQSECEYIEEIARDVFEKLYSTEEIGIQSSVKKIETLLSKQPWGVRSIGIFGKPGIGKTTLAAAVFRRMFSAYDHSCFIKDFHTRYNQKKLGHLPTDYLSNTPMKKFDLNNSNSKPSYRKKRVLVVLDDARKSQNAKSYLGGFDKFGPGSLIIITSRNKKVLQECKMSEIYELKGLNDEDALKLFTRCGFGDDVIEEELLEHSMKAIERFRGNPLAIRAHAKEFKSMTTIESEPVLLPESYQVFVNCHDLSCEIVNNKYMKIIPYEEDHDKHEEFPSYHNDVLATRDTIILNGHMTHDKSDRWLYQLDYYSVKSLFEHIGKKAKMRNVFNQVLANKLQKFLQSFSNTSDYDQPDLRINLSCGDIEVVVKKQKIVN